jgi:hypothetical protein
MARIYSNGIETLTRINPTYGYTDKYDVQLTDSKAFDMWLVDNNFELIGVDNVGR